jgi:creatinine amidohydrolase
MTENPALSIKFHNWYNQPRTWETAMAIDRSGSHGNWMENFPWTRLANTPSPSGSKPGIDTALMKASPPAKVRDMLGDGSFGGEWRKPDEDMLRLWQAGVAETRAALEGPWPTR